MESWSLQMKMKSANATCRDSFIGKWDVLSPRKGIIKCGQGSTHVRQRRSWVACHPPAHWNPHCIQPISCYELEVVFHYECAPMLLQIKHN